MNRYKHLNKETKRNKFDWQNNLFKKSLPPKAFDNELTKNVLLSAQKILVKGFDTTSIIKKYFRF